MVYFFCNSDSGIELELHFKSFNDFLSYSEVAKESFNESLQGILVNTYTNKSEE